MSDLTEVSASGDKKLTETPEVTIAGPVEIAVKRSPSDPATTEEEDRHTRSARAINYIWEISQASIALMVVASTLYAAVVQPNPNVLLANAFFLVIGFYFGRTNHARSGGVPDKP